MNHDVCSADIFKKGKNSYSKETIRNVIVNCDANGQPNELQQKYIELMTEVGNEVWPVLFGVSVYHV